ncbi:DNA-binding transcriptional regulator, AcrR family [Prauserella marina]|uniref:DNA-binding transcriptional regulator, AcrR family n=1 Tax=Prauserella marina TaxID=530584 RepID=A0A1G6JIT1_9PSEU|nr:TetR/AcrR family transcriptional regulator [Prauserella marina]PWV84583.1 TetR family transcriptional regulator [Prauserella marina]SDC18577.1 DNA-binding transcriptional regulator, AcrR family [Prauserella marina]
MPPQRATSVQEVVDAAARVFERKGFVEATITDIAAEAGVSKPTVYQYVSSKRWLLETIVEQVIYPLRHSIEEIVDSDLDSREKLLRYLQVQVNSAVRYQTYYAVLISDQHQLSPQALRNYQSWARDVNRAAAGLVEQCVKDGVIRSDVDVMTMVNLVNGMTLSIARWYRPDGRISVYALFDQLILLLSGFIKPEPA